MGINSILYSVFESIALRMTVITLFIMAIKLVFKNKLTAKMHCMIWVILCIQLFFCIGGVKIQTSASIYNVIPEAPSAPAAVSEPVQTAAAPGGIDVRNVIAAVWVIGAGLMLLWHVTVFAAYRISIRRAPEVTDAETLARLRGIRIKLGIASSRRKACR